MSGRRGTPTRVPPRKATTRITFGSRFVGLAFPLAWLLDTSASLVASSQVRTEQLACPEHVRKQAPIWLLLWGYAKTEPKRLIVLEQGGWDWSWPHYPRLKPCLTWRWSTYSHPLHFDTQDLEIHTVPAKSVMRKGVTLKGLILASSWFAAIMYLLWWEMC